MTDKGFTDKVKVRLRKLKVRLQMMIQRRLKELSIR